MGRGRRRKNRTHVKELQEYDETVPKSFVFSRGKISQYLGQLVENMKEVMEPNTATNLKSKKRNTLKDFVSVAGPLGISQFLIFSATNVGTYMKVGRVPQGPTLTFQVMSYSLMSDVRRILRNPMSLSYEKKTVPLLILSGFSQEDSKENELIKVTFKELFPALNIDKINLDECKRVVLLHLDRETGTIHFRHYVITTNIYGLNKSIKSVVKKKTDIDAGKFEDISDFVLSGVGMTESDAEDSALNTVQEAKNTKQSLRLQEIGPRMDLELVKIEENLCTGSVWYHKYESRTEEEIKDQERKLEEKRLLRIERRKAQEANIEKKKRVKFDINEDEEMSSDDNLEYYRQEVGEEPTPEEAALLKHAQNERSGGKFNPLYKSKKKRRRESESDDQFLNAAKKRGNKKRRQN
eukprot:TRINITY_DN3221_c0_g1_i1.p1 TRINITY_DN3221_c0_g1~~TRINITY_DN3221_c0_g1_i1.p1  ORF type:complete len:409 (+),score=124.54 TRINITY_DN3221_c0_g1_i1:31-1257(+)